MVSDETQRLLDESRRERAEFDAKVADGVARGLCVECARGYHINHDGGVRGTGECRECPCEERFT